MTGDFPIVPLHVKNLFPANKAADLTIMQHDDGTGELVTLDDASRWVAGGILIGALSALAAQRVAKSRRYCARAFDRALTWLLVILIELCSASVQVLVLI